MNHLDKDDKLFYMSYANLVAGLLFVFLFILAGILLKSALTRDDFENQRAVLAGEKAKFEQEKQNFAHYQEYVFEFGKKLSMDKNNLNAQDKNFLALLTSLEDKDKKLRTLKDDFVLLKGKLKELNFIKNNFIFELQAKFDSQITLDAQTGALILPSESVFETNSPLIKNEMKPKLRGVFNTYFNTILQNKELVKALEYISLEVCVDDEGFSLPHKIDLSIRRTNELMTFIHSFYKDERVQKYLLASGRVVSKNTQSGVAMRVIISDEFVLQKVEELLNR